MIGLNGYMPASCMECRINHLIMTGDKVYDVCCYVHSYTEAKIIHDVPIGTRPADCPLIDLSRYEDVLEDIEPADVAPVVHGRWIWKPTKQYCPPDCWYPPINHEETWNEKDGTWLEDEMYCSKCSYHNFREVKFNFCPNCGAKMDAQKEG